jgi:DnaK suppressor protein
MDESRARTLLTAQRAEVVASLNGIRATEIASEPDHDIPGDMVDAAEPLVEEATSDSIAGDLQERLAAIDRALARLAAGTYGRSVLSGQPIPDERLEADPSAEVTIEEARARR